MSNFIRYPVPQYPREVFKPARVVSVLQVAAEGAISGVADLTFANSGTLIADGVLAGTSSPTFANTGTLTAKGALAGVADFAFTNTGTLTEQAAAGALAGEITVAFTNIGTLVGDGVLAGTTDIVFTNSGLLTGVGGEPAAPTGGSGYPTYVRRRRSLEERLRDLVDLSARELYEDVISAPVPESVKQEAAKVIRPFASSNKLVPPAPSVDWPVMEKELVRVRELLRIWQAEVLAREIEQDDEEVLLLASL